MRKFKERICEGCKEKYTPRGGAQLFCNQECYNKANMREYKPVVKTPKKKSIVKYIHD